jgi:hypothetical protein
VAALSSNGTLVAGASGVLRGSLFVPTGGQYYLKVTDGTVAPTSTNTAPARHDEVPSIIVPDTGTPSSSEASWHLQVIQLPDSVSSTDTLTVFAPYFTVPDSAFTTPSAPSAPSAPPKPELTKDQVSALVSIKGDNDEGHGFLLRDGKTVYVVAHLRLISANPNLQICASSGAPVKILSMKAASDRNLVMIAVQDDHLTSLLALDKTSAPAAPGDYVLIPIIGKSDPTAAHVGKLVNLAPDRVDFDARAGNASNSAPLISVSSGRALGIVTAEKRVDLTETLAKAWPENPAPGSENITPYFGLSLSNVPAWEPLDVATFDRESLFLKSFHETTRSLDAYLNGRVRSKFAPASTPTSPPDSRDYKSNAQLMAASDNYHRLATGFDKDQALDAARELLDDLQTISRSNVDQLQHTNMTYSINRRRAQEELAYRKAVLAELDAMADNIPQLNAIARSR